IRVALQKCRECTASVLLFALELLVVLRNEVLPAPVLNERANPLSVKQSQYVRLTRLLQPLGAVLPDRREHPEALIGQAQEALLDERLQGVEIGACDLLCGLERAASCEDREAGEELLLAGGEEVVRPFDRVAERLLARV